MAPKEEPGTVSYTLDPKQAVHLSYRNYRGELAIRKIEPGEVFFGSTEHHPVPQYLMLAWDYEKQAERTFAMKDIHCWIPCSEHGKPAR